VKVGMWGLIRDRKLVASIDAETWSDAVLMFEAAGVMRLGDEVRRVATLRRRQVSERKEKQWSGTLTT
jgi:hypothetical protein